MRVKGPFSLPKAHVSKGGGSNGSLIIALNDHGVHFYGESFLLKRVKKIAKYGFTLKDKLIYFGCSQDTHWLVKLKLRPNNKIEMNILLTGKV